MVNVLYRGVAGLLYSPKSYILRVGLIRDPSLRANSMLLVRLSEESRVACEEAEDPDAEERPICEVLVGTVDLAHLQD